MTVVPAGRFTMGSPDDEQWRGLSERRFELTVERPFAIGAFSVTREEWDLCVAAGGCHGQSPEEQDHQSDRRLPIVNVSWDDATAYAKWLSSSTGRRYRLPSEAEREYAARAGSSTAFWWGPDIVAGQANVEMPSTRKQMAGRGATTDAPTGAVPVDRFEPNPWGLYNVHGNVWEWTADCWNETVEQRVGTEPLLTGDCGRRVGRGGSWKDYPSEARAATRFGFDKDSRNDVQGFRVVRELP